MLPWLVWVAIKEYHRLCGIDSRNFFLMILETGSPRARPQQISGIWWGCSSWFADCHLFIVTSLSGEREREQSFCSSLLIKALIPFMRAAPSWPNHVPKPLPPNTIIFRIGDTTYRFGGWYINIQSISKWQQPLVLTYQPSLALRTLLCMWHLDQDISR